MFAHLKLILSSVFCERGIVLRSSALHWNEPNVYPCLVDNGGKTMRSRDSFCLSTSIFRRRPEDISYTKHKTQIPSSSRPCGGNKWCRRHYEVASAHCKRYNRNIFGSLGTFSLIWTHMMRGLMPWGLRIFPWPSALAPSEGWILRKLAKLKKWSVRITNHRSKI